MEPGRKHCCLPGMPSACGGLSDWLAAAGRPGKSPGKPRGYQKAGSDQGQTVGGSTLFSVERGVYCWVQKSAFERVSGHGSFT